jgi:CBS domain-containing protein
MLRLRDIMTTDLVTLDPNLSIREAIDVLTSKRISGAPVVAGTEVIGVVSATDLLQLAAALPGLPSARDLGTDAGAASRDDDEPSSFPHLSDDPSGVYFSELWEDGDGSVVERMTAPTTAGWNSLEEHVISEAMTRAPIHSLTPETAVHVAADYMRREKIHRVLVMTGQKLVGLVTTTDITRAVADGKLTAHTYVFEHHEPPIAHNTWGRRR